MDDRLRPRIAGTIDAKEIVVGRGVVVEEGVVISGKGKAASRVVLGDFSYIGQNTRILTPFFSLGDYSKLHGNTFGHGEKGLQIGRNCWIGGNVVLDSNGGLDILDNVGIGAHSQLWTHIQFGDIVQGCRFYDRRYMQVGEDVWFVGHCIVSPVKVGERSMAMVGSVVTRDMLSDRIYAGVPAVDVTDKLGTQFEYRTVEQKVQTLQGLIDEFVQKHPQYRGQLRAIASSVEEDEKICCFNCGERTYRKRYLPAEVAFLQAHVPLVKFFPAGEGLFFEPQE